MNTRNADRITAVAGANGWTQREGGQFSRPTANGTESVIVRYSSRGAITTAERFARNVPGRSSLDWSLGARDAGKLDTVLSWLEFPAALAPAGHDYEADRAAERGIAEREAREAADLARCTASAGPEMRCVHPAGHSGSHYSPVPEPMRSRAAERRERHLSEALEAVLEGETVSGEPRWAIEHSYSQEDCEAILWAHLGAGHSAASAHTEAVALSVSIASYVDAAAVVHLRHKHGSDRLSAWAARLETEQASRDADASYSAADAIHEQITAVQLDRLAGDLQSRSGMAHTWAHVYHLAITGEVAPLGAPRDLGALRLLHSLQASRASLAGEAAIEARSMAHTLRMTATYAACDAGHKQTL